MMDSARVWWMILVACVRVALWAEHTPDSVYLFENDMVAVDPNAPLSRKVALADAAPPRPLAVKPTHRPATCARRLDRPNSSAFAENTFLHWEGTVAPRGLRSPDETTAAGFC